MRWSRGGNGRISGGASVIGDIVYYADLGNKRTIGLGARTGRKVFEHERGSYNPVVSDGETIFLTGYHALYALAAAVDAPARRARAKAARARKARQAQRPPDLPHARPRGAPRQAAPPSSAPTRRCVEAPAGAAPQGRPRASACSAPRRLHKGHKGKISRSYQRCVGPPRTRTAAEAHRHAGGGEDAP